MQREGKSLAENFSNQHSKITMKTKPEKAFDVLSSLVSEHRAAQTNLASEQKYFDGINEKFANFP